MNIVSLPRSMRLVRGWVRACTIGLSGSLRDARREEIAADLWEQAREARFAARPASELASQTFLRWAMGVPDDLLWRVAQIKNRSDESVEEATMGQPSMSRAFTYRAGGLALAVFLFTFASILIAEIGYYNEVDLPWPSEWTSIVLVAWPLGVGLIAAGFWVMKRSPPLGGFLVVAASASVGVSVFWLIIPPIVAIALSVYAVQRARRLDQQR